MISKLSVCFSLFFAIIFSGCKPGTVSTSYLLSREERTICDTLGIDTTIVKELRIFNASKIEPFHYSLSKIITKDSTIEADPIFLQGLVLQEQNSKSYDLVFSLKDIFKGKGYSIIMLENNFNIDSKADQIAILKTTDKYSILRQIATDGINYEITNDSLISIIKDFDRKYSLELIAASGDWCEFVIHKDPANWLAFAKEVYKVCPDVVDQGTGDVEKLADEMKRTRRLYFWWD